MALAGLQSVGLSPITPDRRAFYARVRSESKIPSISARSKQRGEIAMANITPKTFYDWLMAVKAAGLKCGPLEAFQDERFNHALSKGAVPHGHGTISFGMWDHRTNAGFLDPDRSQLKTELREIKPAPPIPDGDKEWDL
jgi:hypothetical protein